MTMTPGWSFGEINAEHWAEINMRYAKNVQEVTDKKEKAKAYQKAYQEKKKAASA